MAFLNFIATTLNQPNAIPWEWLILKVFSFVASYGWRVVLFTVLLKLLLYPLDLFQRVKMRKNEKITKRIKPEMDKLQKQYGGDKQLFSQKQMELNKREGFSYFSACLPMILSMVIFIWLFSSLNIISQYMNVKQYTELYDVYIAEETLQREEGVTDETAIQEAAQQAVFDYYYGEEGNKESFLWIKNIWAADVPWTKPINNYDSFIRSIGNSVDSASKYFSDADKTVFNKMMSSDMYKKVTGRLYSDSSNTANGYLVLPILAMGLSFLSQFITTRLQKKSGQAAPTGGMAGSMKFMMILMPLMMGFFALTYTSAFTIYMVINSSITILLNLFTNFIFYMVDRKQASELIATGVVLEGADEKHFKKLNADKNPQTETSDKKGKMKKSKDKAPDPNLIIKYGRPDPNDSKTTDEQKPKKLKKR